jgi:malonate transporter
MMLEALLPIFLLIFFGALLARLGWPGAAFWPAAERLIYYVFFPCLLFSNLAQAPLAGVPVSGMALALIGAVLAVSALLLLLRPLLGLSGAAFGSLFQGAIRQNTYIGLAGAVAVAGPMGLTLSAVAIAALVPLLNLLSVSVLSVFGTTARRGWHGAFGQMLRNPLILACAAGVAVNSAAWRLPDFAASGLELLGRAALPLGLLSVGAALRLRVNARELWAIALSSGVKLLLSPWLAWLLCAYFGVGGQAALVAVLFAALPTSVSSYLLARLMGGDESLMAAIITAQTLLAMFSLPWLLSSLT